MMYCRKYDASQFLLEIVSNYKYFKSLILTVYLKRTLNKNQSTGHWMPADHHRPPSGEVVQDRKKIRAHPAAIPKTEVFRPEGVQTNYTGVLHMHQRKLPLPGMYVRTYCWEGKGGLNMQPISHEIFLILPSPLELA